MFAVDTLPDRLAKARELGAETIDFNAEHPVERIKELTDGHRRPAGDRRRRRGRLPAGERPGLRRVAGDEVAVQGGAEGDRNWRARARPGAASGCRATPRRRCSPGPCRRWPRPGTLSIIGVYPRDDDAVPDRHGDDEEPHHADGQLPAPQVHPPADRGRAWKGRSTR